MGVSGRSSGIVTILVVWGALVTLGCGLVRTPVSSGGPDAKPAALPGDLCALVGDALLAQLTPDHEPPEHRNTPGSYTSYAYCTVDTDTKKARSTAEGSLDLELQRHGSVADSPREEARDDFESGCENYGDTPNLYGRLRTVDGVGERACAAVSEEDGTATVHLLVLAGADYLNVTYRAEPSNAERALAGAKTVANNILARL